MKFRRVLLTGLALVNMAGFVFAGTFETVGLVPSGMGPTAVTVGDFNKDGKLDMVVANNIDESVQVFLGNGNGTFKLKTTIGLDGPPTAVAVGDFNGDGILDVAVVTVDVFVLLGNGDGTFRIGGMYSGGYSPSSIAIADFNHDGKLDLAVVVEQGTTGVDVLLGNGDGTFQSAVEYPAGDGPVSVATGDFNNDGKIDLVVSDVDPYTLAIGVSVLLGKGNGTFGSSLETENLNSGGGNVVVGDFNHDGKLDVAVGGAFATNGYNTFLVLLFGTGTGKFDDIRYINTDGKIGLGDSPFLVAGDFNGNGATDLVATDVADNEVTVLPGSGNGNFKIGAYYSVGAGNLSMAAGDFNGDGRLDLVVTNDQSNDVSVLLNKGGGHFFAARDFHAGAPYFVSVGDFDRDGKQDLVAGYNVLFGNGKGEFGAAVEVTGLDGEPAVTADFKGDGISDIVTFGNVSDDVTVILSNGDGTFQDPKNYFAGPEVACLAVGDFNGDGKPDLAVCAGTFVVVLLGNGDGTFQSPIDTFLSYTTSGLAAADFNGDGKLDLAVITGADVSILLGNGDGSFRKPMSFLAGSYPVSIAAGDFNGDGIVDLAVADFDENSANVLLGNGDGKFGKASTYPVGEQPLWLVTGDFNSDGKVDIAVSALGANAYVLFGDGNGKFRPAKQLGSALGGDEIAIGDFNGDGKRDLVVTDSRFRDNGGYQDGVTVLLNVTKKTR